jgi:hypothetical protein
MREYLDERALSELIKIPRRSLQRWRSTGEGPEYIRAGARRILYPLDAVQRWANERLYRHTADELARKSQAVSIYAKGRPSPRVANQLGERHSDQGANFSGKE